MPKKLLVFHPVVAPYRIDFFNRISDTFSTTICLYEHNIEDNTFSKKELDEKFIFTPNYLERSIKLLGRKFHLGHIKYIKEIDPDIVFVTEYGESLWISVAYRLFHKKNFKIVSICDDSRQIAQDCSGIRKLSRDLLLNQIDGLILCNEEAQEWYKRNKQYAKSFVFPIIQDEVLFKKNELAIADRAKEHILDHKLIGKRVFLFVGRLSPEKNIEYLIDSFIKQHEEHPENILFIIGGETNKAPKFRKLQERKIEDAGAESFIHFLGRIEGDELKSWFFVSQIFVLPSFSEAFGAVINEALISGEYVMVSNKAGSDCLVDENNGEVIDIEKPCIDFNRVCSKIKPIEEAWKPNSSKMPCTFGKKMDDLLKWIESL